MAAIGRGANSLVTSDVPDGCTVSLAAAIEQRHDEAIALIADRMRTSIDAHGADSVVAFTYNSSTGAIEGASLTEALFAELGATIAEHTICAHTNGLA